MSGWSVVAPAASLRRYVSRYVGYWHEGDAGIHRGLPSRHLTLVIGLEGPVELAAMPDRRRPAGAFAMAVGGLHAAPALVRRAARESGIHIDVTPAGARALFGMPAAALASAVVDGADVVGGVADELRERLTAVGTWPLRFTVLDEVLGRLAHGAEPARPEVAWAWDRLVADGGLVEVGALAAEVGWSRRHFHDRFCAEYGLAPKVAARVVRFERSRRLLERRPGLGLADIAAECGYYDQAHLTRDWRELAGCSPGRWRATELPFVQDSEDVRRAS